jgi:homospermidine synthase
MILIGCGAVGTALLELQDICRYLPPRITATMTIIEPLDISHNPVLVGKTYRHIKKALSKSNLAAILTPLLHRGEFVFDCSVNVDALAIMKLCHAAHAMYTNCSMEDWETPNQGRIDPSPRALFARSLCSRVWSGQEQWRSGSTMLADQGMNPGIVSSFALKGIYDMAVAHRQKAAIEYMRAGRFAEAAAAMGIQTIHITERDTQTLKRSRPRGVFYNTWSSAGLIAEALDPVQIGWGIHERGATRGATASSAPLHAVASRAPLHTKNMCIIPERGMDVSMWSYSPDRRGKFTKYKGFLIPHGEANTLSATLSTATYRPSVYFVYQPCSFGRASLKEMKYTTSGKIRRTYKPTKKTFVPPLPQIKAGYDAVGALLWSTKYGAWWSGTVLDIKDMAPIGVKYSGPTTIQVAIALLSAARWMIENQSEGFITPENLPWQRILNDCVKYLGLVYSGPVDAPKLPNLQLSTFMM